MRTRLAAGSAVPAPSHLIAMVAALMASPPCLAQLDDVLRLPSQAPANSIAHRLLQPQLKVERKAGGIRHVALSANDKVLSAVLADGAVRLWDLEAGVQRPPLPGRGAPIAAACPGPDGRAVGVAQTDGALQVFDAFDGSLMSSLQGRGPAARACVVDGHGKRLVSGHADGVVRIWDVNRVSQPRALAGHGGEVTAVAVSPDSRRLLTGGTDRTVRLWDLATGQPAAAPTALDGPVLHLDFARAGRVATVVTQAGTLFLLDVMTGVPIGGPQSLGPGVSAVAVDEHARLAAVGETNGTIREVSVAGAEDGSREFLGHTAAVRFLFFATELGRLISGADDGSIRVWDPKTGEHLLRVEMTATGWAVIDRQGRFDGSEQGLVEVAWQAGGRDLSLDRFGRHFFEPGLLAEYLGMAHRTPAKVPGSIPEGMALPPGMEIDLPTGARDADRPLRLVVVATDQGGGIGTIDLYHNGKLVQPGARLQQQDVTQQGKHLRAVAFQVQPVPGVNTFTASGTGLWEIDGRSERLTETFSGPRPTSTLHLVGIGLNKYSDPGLNLDYSVADAKALVATIMGGAKGLFARQREYLLLDEQATRKGILAVLEGLSGTAPADVVVVYFSGHGLSVGNEWYFLPYETRKARDPRQYTAQGIAATKIEELLAKAPAQKVLVLIDSCYSGAGAASFEEQQAFQRRYLRELSRTAGVTVLSAARKDQVAAEMKKLGHGLFTYIVLSGLGGKSDQRPRDGSVTAHEVVAYAAQTVPAFSRAQLNYVQEPVAFALGADFALARVP